RMPVDEIAIADLERPATLARQLRRTPAQLAQARQCLLIRDPGFLLQRPGAVPQRHATHSRRDKPAPCAARVFAPPFTVENRHAGAPASPLPPVRAAEH